MTYDWDTPDGRENIRRAVAGGSVVNRYRQARGVQNASSQVGTDLHGTQRVVDELAVELLDVPGLTLRAKVRVLRAALARQERRNTLLLNQLHAREDMPVPVARCRHSVRAGADPEGGEPCGVEVEPYCRKHREEDR